MNLSRWKIGAKLGLATGVVMFSMAMLGGIALWQLAQINQRADDIATNWLPSIQTIGKMKGVASDMRRAELQLALERAVQGEASQQQQRLRDGRARLAQLQHAYQPLVSSPEEGRLFEHLEADIARYLQGDEKYLTLAKSGAPDDAQALLLGELLSAFRAMSGTLDKLEALNDSGARAAQVDAEATYKRAWALVLGLLVGAALLAAGFTTWIGRQIARPIAAAVAATTRVGGGDMTQPIEAQGSDEPAQLLRALGHMQQRLVQTVAHVRDNAESVSIASSQIASGNADLSHRTEQQAASLQQSASAMAQLGSSVKQNSDNAREADLLAKGASAVASAGGRVVAEVVGTMQRIHESSRKISDIIAVIDGIAFQTNILSLNAAVEAARAGEQGRGFAVVAGEVRTLAQRSATAAKEIKQLISDSVERVGAGTEQVERARVTMAEVVGSIERVCQVVAQISAATIEQAGGIAEVGKAVTQMDNATQQNAALVEQSAAAADSLSKQAAQLVDAVAVFRLAPAAL